MPWFEDFAIGDKAVFGRYDVTREEVVAFARAYDPQPFHLDDDAAAGTYFGRLAASGWHTCAMMTAMVVEAGRGGDPEQRGSLGAVGVDAIRWLRPVYPGDTLRCESEVLATRASSKRPGMGSVRSRVTVLNQHDQPVMVQEPITLHRIRDG